MVGLALGATPEKIQAACAAKAASDDNIDTYT
jgi:hypothetical protein